MNNKEFKSLFGEVAKRSSFEEAYSGWFRESSECIVVLDLQKSNYGNYYELNIKIFIQGAFGNKYVRNKDLVKKEIGNVFTRQPKDYSDALNLDDIMDESKRKELLQSLFSEFIDSFTNMALTKAGIWKLAEQKKILLLPAVREELEKLQ